MSTAFLCVALALGQAQPEQPVTDAEKTEFLKLLATLPTRGEFFTSEAIQKAAPYTRVLLALTEKDLAKYSSLYPFYAISAGLLGAKDSRQYALNNFSRIAHPKIKLGWAIGLFRAKSPPPEVVAFLRQTLDSKKEGETLSAMLGPEFEDFKERVILVSETGKRMKVELVKRHTFEALPKYGGGFDYTATRTTFAPGHLLHAVRPLKQRGELITRDLATGKTRSLLIPQPEGFKPRFDFVDYFESPVLSVNARGDLCCLWTIEGNGDHGLALLKKGADAFVVKRSRLYLGDSRLVPAPDGSWCLLQIESGGQTVVHHVDEELKLTRVGAFRRPGWLADARFLSKDVLHVLCVGVSINVFGDVTGDTRLRCVDYDVREPRVLHNRELLRLKSASGGSMFQFDDGSLHYLWGVNDREQTPKGDIKRGPLTGLYYQAEADATTLKIGGGHDYRAVAVGGRIITCYTMEGAPDKVFFRVIGRGTLGPETEVTIGKGRKHPATSEYMALHAEAERVWWANTLESDVMFEMRLVDAKGS